MLMIFIIALIAFVSSIINSINYSTKVNQARFAMSVALETNSIQKIKNALIINEEFLDEKLITRINSRLDDLIIEKEEDIK